MKVSSSCRTTPAQLMILSLSPRPSNAESALRQPRTERVKEGARNVAVTAGKFAGEEIGLGAPHSPPIPFRPPPPPAAAAAASPHAAMVAVVAVVSLAAVLSVRRSRAPLHQRLVLMDDILTHFAPPRAGGATTGKPGASSGKV